MKPIGIQLRQTIISTGVVGACFGAVAVIGMLLVRSGSNARLIAQGTTPPSWWFLAADYVFVFIGATLGSVLLFGLLPAAIGYLIGRLAGRSGKASK